MPGSTVAKVAAKAVHTDCEALTGRVTISLAETAEGKLATGVGCRGGVGGGSDGGFESGAGGFNFGGKGGLCGRQPRAGVFNGERP